MTVEHTRHSRPSRWSLAASVLLAMALLAPGPAARAQQGASDAAPAAPQAETPAATPAPDGPSPGSTPGAAEAEAGAPEENEEADLLLSPLAPAPTTSPRKTFTSFRRFVQDAADTLRLALKTAADEHAVFDNDKIRALKADAFDDVRRAASTFDLSAIPPVNRRTVATNSVLLLEEVLDRIPLPDLERIPDDAAVDAGAAPNGWVIPGTEIRMVRSEAPDGEPRYLFSAETLQRLPAFYAQVREAPKLADVGIDYYQYFIVGPGPAMPLFVHNMIARFPEWLRVSYADQAVWQWIAMALATLIAIASVVAAVRLEARRSQSLSAVKRSAHRLMLPVFVILVLSLYEHVIDDYINVTGQFLAITELVVESLQALTLAVATIFAFNVFAATIISTPRIKSESLDASLIRLSMRVLGIAVAGYIVFLGATRVGLPLYGVIAGLGVGGLAIALAVRPTLENFIGGIILYADRPVKVGDFCKFGDMLGTVETIGLRSTKIRGLDRTLVTVQNADFSQMSITNFTRRDSNLMNTMIGLRYETSPEQLRAIVGSIAEMLRADERVKSETVRVVFRGFGSYSLDVEIWTYVLSADWGTFLRIQEELLLKVMDIVRENGSAFAIPAQTTYLGTDLPPNTDPAALPAPELQAAT
ncbi:mechanosensitive ion channel family protein [Acuticoccus sediminis]|uniref:mechanosensitive ion channel family protein n=1 Tax=Acuticoccus sediminis TaxID=2184697 RepID=UPI001CFE0AB4|nr:mechanosensitive ion channel family protein [Acuticoccus sediminis]